MGENLGKITVDGNEVTLYKEKYPNGRIAIQGVDPDGDPWARYSVNLPGMKLGDAEFVVSNDVQDEEVDALLELGCFEDTGRTVDYGHVSGARVLRLTDG
jgi:hypothetical protein